MLAFPVQEESLFATDMFGPLKQESPLPSLNSCLLESLSRALSLEEYHEERESIRTLKEFYEHEPPSCSMDSIGLPPGLEDFGEPKDLAQAEFFHSSFGFVAPQFWQEALDASADSFNIGDQLFNGGEQQVDASMGTFAAGQQTSDLGGQPLIVDAQPFNVSGRVGKQLNADAQPFNISGKPLNADAKPFNVIAKPLNANAQPFDMGGQTFNIGGKPLNADAKPFDMVVHVQSFDASGQSNDSMEPFDVSGELFHVQDHSFDANAPAFDDDMKWFQAQSCWDTVLSTSPPARSWIE